MVENEDKLKKIELQLKELLNEEDSTQKWLESLQAETDADKNIFSPRLLNDGSRDRIDDAKGHIEKTKQEIEYIKSFLEAHLIKKQEYEHMLKELDEMSGKTL